MNMRPPDVELFALYHLGLDGDGVYKFRNLTDVAKIFRVQAQTVQQWLCESSMDPDSMSQVEFNLAKWHVEAQFVAATGAQALAQRAWDAYTLALKHLDPHRVYHSVDYDDLWGDGWKGDS